MDTFAKIGVAIVTYKGKDVLDHCLGALARQSADLIIDTTVVDNASNDGTDDMVRAFYPNVQFIQNADNFGPARAFNKAIQMNGDAEYLLVMNNDVELERGCLLALARTLDQNPSLSGARPKLVNLDGSRQYQRARIVEIVPSKADKRRKVSFLGTTCALVRRSCWEDVGPFDETYYFYNEDLDWSHRARKKGHRFAIVPEAEAVHHVGVGRKQNWPAIKAHLYASNVYYFWRNWGPTWARIAYRLQRIALLRDLRKFKSDGRTSSGEAAVIQEAIQRMDTTYEELKGARL